MKKPNFIIIYCDDLGYGDLSCYGSEHVKTPHLDQLADDGIKLMNWYSNSPVCSPSRAALLTGKYPLRTGVDRILSGKRGSIGLSTAHETLATKLKSLGYNTAMFGKWHLGASLETGPNAHGFDEFFGFRAGCVDYYSHIFYYESPPVHDLWNNDQEVWNNGEYLTELISDKAVQFIEKQAHQEQPFFMYVPYNAPHYPMHAPEKYMARFSHLPWDRQVMAAMIAAMDDGVGQIVDALKQTGNYDDTVIFFSSDNGPSAEVRNWLDGTEDRYYGGSAGIFRGHKASLFDGGIREPAILSYPAVIPKGQVSEELGVMMDIFPTFLSFAKEVYSEDSFDGKDVVEMLTAGGSSPHTQVYWEYNGQLAIRQGKWKLVLNGNIDFDTKAEDSIHLSDLEKDPAEHTNLSEQYPELMNQLKDDLIHWYEGLNVID
ncbi:sulfatase-like hydrolase/transferase [Lederbergia lenta]|uniref:Sulfatase family protein n=1 Tax=Lederbergia lenta TaxID=1467 RepID=A0A2X4VS76_LEDLE|nr:sulfatase-like hydrolase/transferase [Lederbergia lenta]MEC2325765.1 sulfatase-like hydrolase/transferase [Lederbergia lenta]SQI53783.1 sulfatase family protein [Lederbergia lenta]